MNKSWFKDSRTNSCQLAQKGEHQTHKPVIIRPNSTAGNFCAAVKKTCDANIGNFKLIVKNSNDRFLKEILSQNITNKNALLNRYREQILVT